MNNTKETDEQNIDKSNYVKRLAYYKKYYINKKKKVKKLQISHIPVTITFE